MGANEGRWALAIRLRRFQATLPLPGSVTAARLSLEARLRPRGRPRKSGARAAGPVLIVDLGES